MNKRIISLLAIVVLLMATFAFTTAASADYVVFSHCGNGSTPNIRTPTNSAKYSVRLKRKTTYSA